MTCIAEIGITAIAEKIADCTVVAIGRQLGYLFQYRSNIDNLRTVTHELNLVEERIKESVDHATRNGEEIHKDIEKWLKKADEITKQAEKFLGDENHAKIRCSMRGLLFLNLVPRYRLSKKAKKMGDSAIKIKGEAKSDNNIGYRPHLQIDFTNKSYREFETRKKIASEIMEALEDGNVRMIGVHGMPGIGKTTLVKEISARASGKKLLSDCVLVAVSKTLNVDNIQNAIAERLGLKLDKETRSERALLLQNRLKREKKFLIILDDVWEELKLEDIGIDFKSDENGCKILFTSRFKQVLSTKMGVDKIFQVGLLEEAEALNWFNHLVAKSVEKDSEFLRLGNEIVNQCARLPVAIATIAGTLKDRALPFWRTALRQLQRFDLAAIDVDMDEKVYRPIELCYNCLGDEEKLFLLLCGLHEEDESISIENLMRYGIGWGKFKDDDTLQSARDKVDGLVFTIKDRTLLLDGENNRTVKMHDVIRDVVISIARKNHMYSFTNNAGVNRLERKALEDSKAISLPYGYVPQLLRGGLEYKQLELIWMSGNEASQIPDNFFEKTKELRVLALFFNDNLEKLSSSLSSLGNLRTLCLLGHHLEDISLIGELKNLEILDLSESTIQELPTEIGQLTLLRMLDLHDCTQLEVIQPNVISNLTSLEELYLEESFKKWDELQGVNGDKRNASLNELKHLDKLTTLHLEIVNIKEMPKDLFSGKTLEQYMIAIGCELTGKIIENYSRCLELSLYENRQLQEHGLEMLLERTQMLSLNGFEFIGVDNIVYELDKAGFPELKLFQLKNNHRVQCLINSMEQNHPYSVFGSLEKLLLDNLENLEKICDGELTKESFGILRFIKVQNCNRLKNLLPFSMSKLEKIKINNCIMMEEIIVSHEEGDNSKEAIGNFPKLCSLRLIDVPRLKSFCSKLKKVSTSEKGKQPVDVDSVTTLFNGKLVSLPLLEKLELSGCNDLTRIWDDQILPSFTSSFRNLTELLVKDCDSLEYLFPSANMATSFVKLRSLEIGYCRNMKEIVRNSEKMDKMSFPKLDSLRIDNLPHLAAFSSEIYIDFPVLTELSMYQCHEFSAFISKSEDEKLPSLFNEKVAFPRLKNLDIKGMGKPKIFISADVFAELEVVEVRDCNNLMKIFTSNMQRTLGSLRRLYIRHCEMVEEVFEIQTSSVEEITHDTIPSSQLISLILWDLPKLEYVWGKDPRGTLTFTHLEEVRVLNCPSLKSIFPFSVAKGLPKLRQLDLYKCGIEKIVEAVGTTVPVPPEFVFPQLKEMILECLENLVCFYPGLHTSSWPSLTSLVLKRCEKVKVWASELSSFQEKHVLHDHDSSPIPQPFIFTKVAFPSLRTLEIEGLAEFKMIWQYKLSSADSFSKLEYVEVRNCNNLVQIFPSSMQRRLHNLKSLEISDCEMVEEVFEIQIMPNVEEVGVRPSMVMISQDLLTADIFWKLKEINVHGCKSLTKMFSSNILRSLQNLSKLVISNCEMLEVVFEFQISNDHHRHEMLEVIVPIHLMELELLHLPKLKHVWGNDPRGTFTFQDLQRLSVDECQCLKILFPTSVAKNLLQLQSLDIRNCGIEQIVAEEKGQNETIPTFVFPQLDSLTLHNLPRLMSFYPGLHTLKWPKLRWLEVSSFMKAEDLSLKFLRFQQTSGLIHHHISFQEPLFSIDEVTSSSQNEDLVGDQEECAGALSRLSVLRLYDMPNLLHLREESSQPQTVFQNLIELDIGRCGRIKKLVSSSISFHNLETLIVRQCHGMPSLLTSRTARSMSHLECLIIFNCKRMEEIIVDAEEGEDMEGEIVLARLKTLVLDCLPSLTCFYSGKYMLGLPDLENVMVRGCFEMLSFSKHGNVVSTPKLHKLVTSCAYRVRFSRSSNYSDCYVFDNALGAVNDTITAVNTPIDLNTIIPDLWKSHPGTHALQQLFCEKDLALSNLSVEQYDI